MGNLSPTLFLLPSFALILVIVLYFSFLRKSSSKGDFKRFSFLALTLAFFLNFAWELTQGPLYKDFIFGYEHIAFCALASVADAIMTLLLYYISAFIFKKRTLIKNLTFQEIILIILGGGISAILVEIWHVSKGHWAYANSMPLIPIIGAGLLPVLQFTILPVLVYYINIYICQKSFKVRLNQ